MAKKTTNDTTTDKLLSKLSNTWAAIIAGCTLLGTGFGAGIYTSDVLNKIQINEINQKQNEQLYNLKKDFDIKIEEILHEKRLLELENGRIGKK